MQAHERANPRPCKNQNAIHLSAKDEHQDSGREKGGSGEPAGCIACFSAQKGRGNQVAGCFPQASGSAQSCDYFQAGGDTRPRKALRRQAFGWAWGGIWSGKRIARSGELPALAGPSQK